MPAAVTGVGPVCSKKDCSCCEPQFAFRFTPLIQLILLRRNGHTYLLMGRFLLTPTPLFIFSFPMWPQTRVSLSAEAPGKHLLCRLPWLAHSKKYLGGWCVLLAVMYINVLIYTEQTKAPNIAPMYKVEIESDHCSELIPNYIGIIYEIATFNITSTYIVDAKTMWSLLQLMAKILNKNNNRLICIAMAHACRWHYKQLLSPLWWILLANRDIIHPLLLEQANLYHNIPAPGPSCTFWDCSSGQAIISGSP